jgi:hypothetical protein
MIINTLIIILVHFSVTSGRFDACPAEGIARDNRIGQGQPYGAQTGRPAVFDIRPRKGRQSLPSLKRLKPPYELKLTEKQDNQEHTKDCGKNECSFTRGPHKAGLYQIGTGESRRAASKTDVSGALNVNKNHRLESVA